MSLVGEEVGLKRWFILFSVYNAMPYLENSPSVSFISSSNARRTVLEVVVWYRITFSRQFLWQKLVESWKRPFTLSSTLQSNNTHVIKDSYTSSPGWQGAVVSARIRSHGEHNLKPNSEKNIINTNNFKKAKIISSHHFSIHKRVIKNSSESH